MMLLYHKNPDIQDMKRTVLLALAFVSLLGITGCDNDTPKPVPAVSQEVETQVLPGNPAPQETGSPTIDEQMDELREKNGDIPQEERDRLNNVPVIPDVFDK